MLGSFTLENPPAVLVDAEGDTYTIVSRHAAECVDCAAPMVFDGNVFRCQGECGGPNVEDGLHPSDITPEYLEVCTMADNGRLFVFTYECTTEDES